MPENPYQPPKEVNEPRDGMPLIDEGGIKLLLYIAACVGIGLAIVLTAEIANRIFSNF